MQENKEDKPVNSSSADQKEGEIKKKGMKDRHAVILN